VSSPSLPRRISLVRVEILTGRTHQIRVHLTHLGHPVLGDDVYCSADFTRKNTHLRRLGLKRVLLHAYSLAFVHPALQTPLTLLAPLPRDMLSVAQFVLSKGPGPTGKHEDSRKLLRLLRDGEPLTPALGHDVASPVPSTAIASNAPSIGATGGEAAEARDLEEEEWDEQD
ncbi:pseudouridine family, partial [Nannochloropsis gaditana]